MIDDDNDDDFSFPLPPALPVYDEVIRELKSAYKSATHGALKEITGVTLASSVSNPAQEDIIAQISVGNYQESPGGEYTASGQRIFEVGLADVRRLAETAPEYRSNFSLMAEQLGEKLLKDIAAYKLEILNWCDEGLPTKEATSVMRPLRLRSGPGR